MVHERVTRAIHESDHRMVGKDLFELLHCGIGVEFTPVAFGEFQNRVGIVVPSLA